MDWIVWAKDAGAYVSPLLMAAIFWLNVDRNRLIEENKGKDDKLSDLSERTITVMTELKTFLFSGRGS